jgi:ubiquinone/menaquinone biosynthesis C-methylase UbiE
MTRFTDPTYLREEQYKTPSNLTARADLDRRFSTTPGSWQHWVMDQLALRPGERVLEVGGGPGWLWRENRDRLSAERGVRFCFSDFSFGMVQAARAGLRGVNGIDFANIDVQALPLPAGAFDLVVANHMLYHVPDLPRAVRELARVLRPGGQLCAATNGWNHMRELGALLRQFDHRYPDPDKLAAAFKYRLENAAEWLSAAFARVEVRRRVDSLWVTDPGALADYAQSMSRAATDLGGVRAAELVRFFQDRMDGDGGIHITKDAGVVLAWADK